MSGTFVVEELELISALCVVSGAVWVYLDAAARGAGTGEPSGDGFLPRFLARTPPGGWGLGTLLAFVVFMPAYVFMRGSIPAGKPFSKPSRVDAKMRVGLLMAAGLGVLVFPTYLLMKVGSKVAPVCETKEVSEEVGARSASEGFPFHGSVTVGLDREARERLCIAVDRAGSPGPLFVASWDETSGKRVPRVSPLPDGVPRGRFHRLTSDEAARAVLAGEAGGGAGRPKPSPRQAPGESDSPGREGAGGLRPESPGSGSLPLGD